MEVWPVSYSRYSSETVTSMNPRSPRTHSFRQAKNAASARVNPKTIQLIFLGAAFPVESAQPTKPALMVPPVKRTFHSAQSAAKKQMRSRSMPRGYHYASKIRSRQFRVGRGCKRAPRVVYNTLRPQPALGYRAPAPPAFAPQMAALRSPTAPCEPPFAPLPDEV